MLRNPTLNAQRGDFVLDTGNAVALVVDSAPLAGQLTPARRHPTGYGATGVVALQELPVSRFQLGAARYTGFPALAFPWSTCAVTWDRTC